MVKRGRPPDNATTPTRKKGCARTMPEKVDPNPTLVCPLRVYRHAYRRPHRRIPARIDDGLESPKKDSSAQQGKATKAVKRNKSGAAHRVASAKEGIDFMSPASLQDLKGVCHSQTITVSLIGRMAPTRRMFLDTFCRFVSKAAQLASRLALFVVERRLTMNQDISGLFGTNAQGGLFMRDCLNICSGKRVSKVIDPAEIDDFCQHFELPSTREVACSNAILVRRDELWKNARKHIETCAQTKITLWIRHLLRRDGVLQALIDGDMSVADAKELTYKVGDAVFQNAPPWNVPASVAPMVDAIHHAVQTTLAPMEDLGLQLYEAAVVKGRERHAEKRRMALAKGLKVPGEFVAAERPSSFSCYAIKNGEAYRCLALMQRINHDFANDRVHKRAACQANPGRSKASKRERGRAIRALPLWQQMVPSTFELMPLKTAGEVDFQFFSHTVGAEVHNFMLNQELFVVEARHASERAIEWTPTMRTNHLNEMSRLCNNQKQSRQLMKDGHWWWKELLCLDNATGDEFRSVGWRRGRTRRGQPVSHTTLARVSGLRTDKSQEGSPAKQLVLTGFRTNARELQLIVERDQRTNYSPAIAEIVLTSKRQHGYDVLAAKGFGALTPTEDGVIDDGALLQMSPGRTGVYGACRSGQTARCVVVDPGQINPMSWGIADLGGMEAGTNDMQKDAMLVTGHVDKATFAAERKTTSARERERRLRGRTRWYHRYTEALADSGQVPTGLARLRARLDTEAVHWERNAQLRGGTELRVDGRIIMPSRDQHFKKKRAQMAYARNKALQWRDEERATIIGFGDGRCRARGHAAAPTKQMIRHMSSILPVVVLSEWGTSSRCPNCRSGAKLESRRIDGVAGAAIPGDNRYEHCSTCNTNWQHDGVSIVNLCWVANEMLKNGHKSRPMWLKRPQTRENSSAPSGAQL
jgi:hypothetical protein